MGGYVQSSQDISEVRRGNGGHPVTSGLPRLHRRAGQQELLRHHQRAAPDGQWRLHEASAGGGECATGIDQADGHARAVCADGAGPAAFCGLQRNRSASRYFQGRLAGAGRWQLWARWRLSCQSAAGQMRLEVCAAAAWQPDASRTRQEHYAGATPTERDAPLAKAPDSFRGRNAPPTLKPAFLLAGGGAARIAPFESYVEDQCYRWFHVLDFAARFGYRLPFTLTQLS